jgi:hypothetical protein
MARWGIGVSASKRRCVASAFPLLDLIHHQLRSIKIEMASLGVPPFVCGILPCGTKQVSGRTRLKIAYNGGFYVDCFHYLKDSTKPIEKRIPFDQGDG